MGNNTSSGSGPIIPIAEYTLFIRINPDLPNAQDLAEFYQKRTGYAGDAGVDLVCPSETSITTHGMVGLGISCEMVHGDVDDPSFGAPSSYWLCARSSIVKTPLFLHNGVGVIDAGYRDELRAAFARHADAPNEPYLIQAMDRMVQIIAPNMGSIRVEIIEQLSETERGTRGFGSTGR